MTLPPDQQEAALLVAQDRLTDIQIAKKAGIGVRTLADWKRKKEFKQEVEAHRKLWQKDIRTRGLADVHHRIRIAVDIEKRLLAAIQARGASEDMQDVPGGKTGMVVKTYKSLKVEEENAEGELHLVQKTVPEYKIDYEAARTITGLHEYVATELGQWKTRHVVEEKREYTEVSIQIAKLIPPNVLDQMIRDAEAQAKADEETNALPAGVIDGEPTDTGTAEGSGLSDPE